MRKMADSEQDKGNSLLTRKNGRQSDKTISTPKFKSPVIFIVVPASCSHIVSMISQQLQHFSYKAI